METLFGVMVPITLFLGLFTTLIFLRKYENDERMAMIEKGMEPVTRKKSNGFGTLRFGLLAIGIGLGALIGFIILQIMGATTDEEVAGAIYPSTILIFGGAGLLLAYIINKKKVTK